MANDTHKFERMGLGKAPFIFIRFEHRTFQACHGAPTQVGGSCDYCGTGISNWFWIESVDGKRSKVGSECIKKIDDPGLQKQVDPIIREHNKKLRKAREKVRAAELQELLKRDDVRRTLHACPHPLWPGEGTLLGYVTWMQENAGMTGKMKTLKIVKKALAQTETK